MPQEKNKIAPSPARVVIRGEQSHFMGVLPPPDMLSEYGRVIKDAPERFMALAEAQSAYRMEIERTIIYKGYHHEARAQWLAFTLSCVVILGSFVLIWQGRDIAGTTMVVGNVAALAGVFVYGRLRQSNGQNGKPTLGSSATPSQP